MFTGYEEIEGETPIASDDETRDPEKQH